MIQSIAKFLNKQTVATVCCTDNEGIPYCFNCVFAFDEENIFIYFKSSEETRHAKLFKDNRQVAGTVLPNKLNPLIAQGVQFTGILLDTEDPSASEASKKYHTKFPFALAKSGTVWTLQVNFFKMTDSSKVFGTKLRWQREATEENIHAI